MICAYVNDRISYGSEYIQTKKQYTSVEDILCDFNLAFQESVHTHRDYQYQNYPNDVVSQIPRYKRSDIVKQIEECPDGMVQDQMMTSVRVRYDDFANKISNLPALQDVELSMKRIFEMDEPFSTPDITLSELDLENLTDVFHPVLTEKDLDFAKDNLPGIRLR